MKHSLIAIALVSSLGLAACGGHQDTQTSKGDSTGTGAAGARVPGKIVSDTTHKGSATGSLAVDSNKTKDTASKK
jgi:ABC-type glycerol-3-phosphate transport system substrate-binding protein